MKTRLFILLLAAIVGIVTQPLVFAYDMQTNSGDGTVCAGGDASFVIKKDGSLWGWGNNSQGQLGNGRKGDKVLDEYSIYQTVPVKIMDSVKNVVTDGQTTFVIKTDNSLWGFGSNQGAQLAAETIDDKRLDIQDTPVKVMEGVKSVSLGDGSVYAIKLDNTLWGWGRNGDNQLGNNFKGTIPDPSYSSDVPRLLQTTPIKLMDNVKMVCGSGSAFDGLTMVIKTDDTLWGWNSNYANYNLGVLDTYNLDGDDNKHTSLYPIKIMDKISSVSIGVEGQILAVGTDGSLWGWGSNKWGELGNGGANYIAPGFPKLINSDTGKYDLATQQTPVKLMDSGVKAVYTGGGAELFLGYSSVTAVLKTDGTLWMCGDAMHGQLLNGGKGNITCQPFINNGAHVNVLCQNTFIKVMDNVSSVGCGTFHTVISKTDGTVWTSGGNYAAQLGDGLKTTTKASDGMTAALSPVKIDITQ